MGIPLILASASPRRRELLASLGVPFEVVPSGIPEIRRPNERPAAFASRVAREKALDVAGRCPGRFVLGADTVVVIDDTVFGKPENRHAARRMLRRLSGITHCVLTAVVLVGPAGAVHELIVESAVEFAALTAGEIDAYLDSGEPFDKAGAYAIQGGARKFIKQVRGSFSNVVGLPIEEVTALLREQLTASSAGSDRA